MEKQPQANNKQDEPEDLQALMFKYLQLHDQMRAERLAFAKLFKQQQDQQVAVLEQLETQYEALTLLKKQLIQQAQSATLTAAEKAYPNIAKQLNTTLSETLTPTVEDFKTHLKHFAYYLQQLRNDRQEINWLTWLLVVAISMICSMLCTSFAVRDANKAYEKTISHSYYLGQAVARRLQALPPKEQRQALQLLKLRREETPTQEKAN
jgi:hypothetical protein